MTRAARQHKQHKRVARRWFRRPLVLVGVAVVALGLAGWGIASAVSGPGSYRIHAVFASAPGVYSGNAVKVLGVRVGSVESVTPGPDGVEVTMRIDKGTRLPASAKAYLMAPNVVNDRFLEVDPAYTGGAALPAGATIPQQRTVTPLSVDDILASVNQLATELGPTAANSDGALSKLLHTVAETLGGTGGSLNASVKNLGAAFGAVSANADDVTSMLNSLGSLTHAASGVSTLYEQFAADLAQVSGTLAQDHVVIGDVLKNLGDVLLRLNTFVHDNRTQLADTLNSLSKVASAVGGQQQSLAQALHVLPLAVQNLGKTIDANGNIRTRYDKVGSSPLSQQVCGDSVLRLLLVSLDQSEDRDSTIDLACGANQVLNSLKAGSGAPDGKNFTLSQLRALGGS